MPVVSQSRPAFSVFRFMLFLTSVKAAVKGICRYVVFLWQHNPLAVLAERQRRLYFVKTYGEVMIKPRVKEKVLDLFLTDKRRRKRLMTWVHSKINLIPVFDFSSCWQDGIALCALLESICPGVCPSYHLLSPHHRVKNCRLGIKLASKYLYVPSDFLCPEEMAIANETSEHKIVQYIFMLKWASENIRDKWVSLHESLIAAKTGRCFVKGSGLRNGIVGRKSKFTAIVSDTIGVFNLLVEVRGPNSEYCGERIVSLHQAKGLVDQGINQTPSDDASSSSSAAPIRYLEDGVGNTFIRRIIPPKFANDSLGEVMQLEFQCGEEGTFYVTFVPRRAGMHTVAIKWQNHHVEGSPYRVKVYKASNVSTKGLKDAREKRVIYDSLSFSAYSGSNEGSLGTTETAADNGGTDRTTQAGAKSKAYGRERQLTVTRRRVLRRIITRNGEDIVIEEAISPSLSRQSSYTDNSDPTDDESKGLSQYRDERRLVSHVNHGTNHGTPPIIFTKQASTQELGTVVEEKNPVKETSCHSKDDGAQKERRENEYWKRLLLRKDTSLNKSTDSNDSTCNQMDKKDQDHSTETNECYSIDSSCSDSGLTRAVRRQSDTRLYNLRRSLVSLSTDNEAPESSGNTSPNADDITCTMETSDIASPALKLLHSSSLKKSCVYISQQAICDSEDDRRNLNEISNAIHKKRKLSSTRSLPIMRRMWPAFQDQNVSTQQFSVQELVKCLSNVKRKAANGSLVSNGDADKKSETSASCFQGGESVKPFITEVTSTDSTLSTVPKAIQNQSADVAQLTTANKSTTTMVTCRQKPPSSGKRHTTTFETKITSKENKIDLSDLSKRQPRKGSLKRQDSIFNHKSSSESSDSDKASSAFSRKGMSKQIVFKTISGGKSPNNGLHYRAEVHIVIPKAKIDKTTQVSDSEIIVETGWNFYEGLYLLFRRISMKVPTFVTAQGPGRAWGTNCDSSNVESINSGLKSKIDVNISPSGVYRQGFCPVPSEGIGTTQSMAPHQSGKHASSNVNAWFDQNHDFLHNLDPQRLAAMRQLTIDTVDSGITDDILSRYNRQTTLDNGHVPLCRRPYRGQIDLDPKLSQGGTKDPQEIMERKTERTLSTNDDLLLKVIQPDSHCSVEEGNGNNSWKRSRSHEASVSLSDSELNALEHVTGRQTTAAGDTGLLRLSDGCSPLVRPSSEQVTTYGRKKLKPRKSRHSRSETLLRSFDSTDDDFCHEMQTTRAQRQPLRTGSGKDPPSASRRNLKTRQPGSSSLEDSYRGFGVSNTDRSQLLGEITHFQCLYSSDTDADSVSMLARPRTGPGGHPAATSDPEAGGSSRHAFGKTEIQHGYLDEMLPLVPRPPRSRSWDGCLQEESRTPADTGEVAFLADQTRETNDIEFSNADAYGGSTEDDPDEDNGRELFLQRLRNLPDDLERAGQTDVSRFRVTGAGVVCGHVGMQNHFQVWTEGPVRDRGSLNVNVTGPRPYSVTETSVLYTGDNLYEVSYEVTHPGIYVISVKWSDEHLQNSPFFAEVSF